MEMWVSTKQNSHNLHCYRSCNLVHGFPVATLKDHTHLEGRGLYQELPIFVPG